MSKKIYDIMPPGVKIKDVPVKSSAKKVRQYKKVKEQSAEENRRSPLREVLIGGGIIFVLLAVYFVSRLPRADVQIWPKTDILVLQEQVKADKSALEVDLLNKVIPAQYIEQEQDISRQFQATGSASNDGKASGAIIIYNKVSPPSPITLKTGTHFLSDSGKYFIILDKVTIPALKGKTPGSIEVKVQAKEAGQDSNIGSSNFSVPKLSGTPYYYSIFAESKEEMTGGYTGKVKKVTNDDILQAKEVLTKEVLVLAENSLRSKLSPDDVLFDDAMLVDVIDAASGVKAGAIADEFEQRAKAKASALVFKKQDLENFVEESITSRLSQFQSFLPESLNIEYNPQLIDIKSGTQTLDLNSSVTTYYKIDKNNLANLFPRKSSGQIKSIAAQLYGDKISNIEIKLWPFWVNKAPKSAKRVKINLNFE